MTRKIYKPGKNKHFIPEVAILVGHNLRAMRLKAGLTQHALGTLLGVSFQQVQKYEQGRNRLPLEKIFVLRQIFDVPYDAFFEGLPENGKSKPHPLKDDPVSISVYNRLLQIDDITMKRKIEKIVQILC